MARETNDYKRGYEAARREAGARFAQFWIVAILFLFVAIMSYAIGRLHGSKAGQVVPSDLPYCDEVPTGFACTKRFEIVPSSDF